MWAFLQRGLPDSAVLIYFKYPCPPSCQGTANLRSLGAWLASCHTSESIFFSPIFLLLGWISNKVYFFSYYNLTSLPLLVEAASSPLPYPEGTHQFSFVCSSITVYISVSFLLTSLPLYNVCSQQAVDRLFNPTG